MDHSQQHWVPSSYLRAWCDPDAPPLHEPYVWRFPKNGGEGRRKAPDNLFRESEFYTLHLPDGQRDLSLEHGLADLEDQFSRIRREYISTREPLSAVDKHWFCAFVAAMHFRTRVQRDALRQQWGHAARIAENMKEALQRMTPEERQRHRPPRLSEPAGESLTIDDARKLADKSLQHMLPTIVKEDLPVLAQMNLAIFTTEDDPGFTTSDHPCVWFDPEGGRRPAALRSRTIEVFMPVSPDSLALLSWSDLSGYRPAELDRVDEANRFQQRACAEYFIVRRNATKPVWFT
jgi:Protein of unknown function (DUF4238)